MIKAIIVEDERLIAEELKYKITEVSNEITIIEILPSVKSAIKWLTDHKPPDLIFTDIQLSDGISFEIFEKIQLNIPVIFTTAYNEYAIQAFKVNGIDYLLKPVDSDELAKAIKKSQSIINKNTEYPLELNNLLTYIENREFTTKKFKSSFLVFSHKQWLPIGVNDIACFLKEAVVYLYTYSGDRFPIDFETLDELEELLDPKVFYRANRQTIISILSISSFKPMDNQKLSIILKSQLKMEVDISREKAPHFKKWLDK